MNQHKPKRTSVLEFYDTLLHSSQVRSYTDIQNSVLKNSWLSPSDRLHCQNFGFDLLPQMSSFHETLPNQSMDTDNKQSFLNALSVLESIGGFT